MGNRTPLVALIINIKLNNMKKDLTNLSSLLTASSNHDNEIIVITNKPHRGIYSRLSKVFSLLRYNIKRYTGV